MTILTSGAVLFILELSRYRIMKSLAKKFDRAEKVQLQFTAPFLLNFVFMVMLPTIVYAALYPILPFTSYRSGFFIALFVFGVGVMPIQIRYNNQYGLSPGLTAFELFWNLLTLLLCIGTVTYLYHY